MLLHYPPMTEGNSGTLPVSIRWLIVMIVERSLSVSAFASASFSHKITRYILQSAIGVMLINTLPAAQLHANTTLTQCDAGDDVTYTTRDGCPRVTNGKSKQDGMKFNHMTRGDFPSIPSDGNWYAYECGIGMRHPFVSSRRHLRTYL